MQAPRWSVGELTRMALLAALLCVSAYIAIPLPITLVNITAQTFFLNLTALLLPPRQATVTVGLWLLMGALGIPVYSGGRGGFGELLGPTGGFIFGFLLAAWLMALLKGVDPSSRRALLVTFVGIPVVDVLGAAWYAIYATLPFSTALLTTCLPFFLGDLLKAVGSVLCYLPLRKALRSLNR